MPHSWGALGRFPASANLFLELVFGGSFVPHSWGAGCVLLTTSQLASYLIFSSGKHKKRKILIFIWWFFWGGCFGDGGFHVVFIGFLGAVLELVGWCCG